MPPCPFCLKPAATRDSHDTFGRQRYACHTCGRDFTAHTASAFASYRWPADVILLAVRWSLSHPLSATSLMELLAERGIDVSRRTVLRWVQTFGPLLAAEIRKHRRPLGMKCYVDEVFFFRGTDKHYLHRANGETTKPIERSHVFTRDRLPASRGVKTRTTGRRFFEGFEGLYALRRGHACLATLPPTTIQSTPASMRTSGRSRTRSPYAGHA
jgi:transposase-like protein